MENEFGPKAYLHFCGQDVTWSFYSVFRHLHSLNGSILASFLFLSNLSLNYDCSFYHCLAPNRQVSYPAGSFGSDVTVTLLVIYDRDAASPLSFIYQ